MHFACSCLRNRYGTASGWRHEAELSTAASQIASGKSQIQSAKNTIAQKERELTEAETELADGRKELDKGRKEYESQKADAESRLADAQSQINDARSDVEKLDEQTWYVNDRDILAAQNIKRFALTADNLRYSGAVCSGELVEMRCCNGGQ